MSFVILVIVVKFPKTSSFFWISYCRKSSIFDKNHWFQLLSMKNDWIIALFLISITFHGLCLGDSIMSSFCWLKDILWLSMKTLLLLLTKSPNARKSVSRLALCLSSVFFVFAFWPLLQICKVWLTQTAYYKTRNIGTRSFGTRNFVRTPEDWRNNKALAEQSECHWIVEHIKSSGTT